MRKDRLGRIDGTPDEHLMERRKRTLVGDVGKEQPASARLHPVVELGDQPPRRLVGIVDAAEIEDEHLRVLGQRVDAAQQPLGRAEEEGALQFEDADACPLLVEDGALVGRAHPLGADDVAAQLAPDDGAGIGVVAENVQPEDLGELAADGDAAHAVAVLVEPRREHADADLSRNDRDDAAGDAALRRHADLVGPLAGIIVHAAAVHHGEHIMDVFAWQRLDAGYRIDAAGGKRRRHHGQVGAGDAHRALAEIDVEHGLRRAADHARLSIM